ncbi:MAG: sulfotransferase family protein [Candidatus Latescibacteria bacterium]|nr:sulfotransferase family protein [Candidatus Latescibacterota bacterium]
MKPDGCTRICLWSGPRNISTALMYSFAQRADTRVCDEPLYAHYLSRTPARHYHPGAEEVLAAQNVNGEQVVEEIILGPCDRSVLFCKQMTHHLVEIDRGFLDHTVNIMLTRDPVDMLPSYAVQVETPSLDDVGYARQVELFDYLTSRGQQPLVLDARRTLADPHRVLTQLCARLGLSFDKAMLRWPAGPRPEDGVWASHWYANVHRSTCFQPYKPKSEPFPERLGPLLEVCRPLYRQLAERALGT